MTQTIGQSGAGEESAVEGQQIKMEGALPAAAIASGQVAAVSATESAVKPATIDTKYYPTELSDEELMSMDFAGC